MNKRLLSVAVGACLFANFALADEKSGFFIGADAALMNAKVNANLKHSNKGKNSTFNGDISQTIPVLDFKLGYRFNESHRVYFTYAGSDDFNDFIKTSVLSIEGDFSTQKFLLGYDFTPKLFRNTRAVLGVYSGYAKTDVDLKTSFLTLSQNYDGFVYGAKLGAIYEITPHNEIELGVKAEQIRYSSKNFYQSQVGSNIYNPKETNYSAYLGYAYKF